MARVPDVAPSEGGGSLMVAWRLDGRSVLVVGGGKVAAGRVKLALDASARVHVVAPTLGAELRPRLARGEIVWTADGFQEQHLEGVDLVLSCLDDLDESATIAALARARRIPVNCADHPPLCDFWFASVHRDGPLQIALSTNGQGPALGSRLVRELVESLPPGLGGALAAFGRLRQRVREITPGPDAGPRRMTWLADLARRWSWEDLASLDDDVIDALGTTYAAGLPAPEGRPRPMVPARTGRVRLVGAGPGDPGLLTVAAREALETADLVLADRLVSPEILDLVRGELRIARKLPGRAQEAQDELDAWTIEAAKAGRDVVRLKCGDPFVFGRGGEELVALAAHGLDAEVVPGVSAALSAPVLAGIPTTMRGHADRILVLTATGRELARPAPPAFDDATTYVFLMGVHRLDALVADLLGAGFPPSWPAAIVESASRPGQRTVRAPLAALAARAAEQGVAAPATVVVGRVVDALASAAAPLAAVG
jgi:uroporphyrin-III C-methyltransferase